MESAISSRNRTKVTQLTKVVSGGQTGIDRAALDGALAAGIEIGGWCPRDRRSEDGHIPLLYPLRETASRSYAVRTEWNVRDSDGTLILVLDRISSGTQLTIDSAKSQGRPLRIEYLCPPSQKALLVDDQVSTEQRIAEVTEWICREHIRTLNVAGPRGSSRKDVYLQALQFLTPLFETVTSKAPRRKQAVNKRNHLAPPR